ncbi:hypothetical protein ScPMuIL_010801 [Solemya velum]
MKFEWAPQAYRLLNGVFCVYKPGDLPVHKVMEIIRGNLTRDLNALPCYTYERKHRDKSKVSFQEKNLPTVTSVPADMRDLSDHRLVLGDRYINSDHRLSFLHGMSRHSSGVLVMGIGSGCEFLPHLGLSRFLRVYHVKGKLGLSTDNFTPKGRIIERTSYRHVTKPRLDKICAAMQANHQKWMFQYAGLDLESQEAYEIASSGLVRPADRDVPPVIYGVKCIEFQPPDFTLEIHAINEKCTFLQNSINDIGLQLKSSAVCTHIQRLRYGHFSLEHSLLRKHWTLEHIIENIRYCRPLLVPEKLFSNHLIGHLEERKKLAANEETEMFESLESNSTIK